MAAKIYVPNALPLFYAVLLLLLLGCSIIEQHKTFQDVTLNQSKVYVLTDNNSYATNSAVLTGVHVLIYNNLNQSIFYLTGCAARPLNKYEYLNNNFQGEPSPTYICAALPQLNELKSGQNTSLGLLLQGEGTYKIGFVYSLTSDKRWHLGATQEEFTPIFLLEEVPAMLNQTLEICQSNGNFSDGIDSYYPYDDCLEDAAISIAASDSDTAIKLCDSLKRNQCYEWLAIEIAKVDLEKAKDACSKEKNYAPTGINFKENCLRSLERLTTNNPLSGK